MCMRVCRCVNVLMFQYADMPMCEHISVLYKVISVIFILQILPLFLPKTLRNHAIFQTLNRAFQQRFRLGVSPDCKMCVRVTYTGEKPCEERFLDAGLLF